MKRIHTNTMQSHHRNGRDAPPGAPFRQPGEQPKWKERRGPQQRRGGRGGEGSGQPAAVELSRTQQAEAKAARDVVLAALPKSNPLAAKTFVEAISLDVDAEAARQLLLANKGLTALPASMGVLCRQLRKLDVSGNNLTDLSALASLQHLSNLNASRNPRLVSLKGLSGTCLSVLNISFCAVESLVGLEHTALTLRTLIANDNQLQFCSPALSTEATHSDAPDSGEEYREALMTAKAHLPPSLQAIVSSTNSVAVHNYLLFASFQQCETVVLSRNTRLAHAFPAWNAEEMLAECGESPWRAAGRDDDSSGEDEGLSDDEVGGRNAKQRAGKTASNKGRAEVDESSPEVQAYKQRKHAIALAHPLSVFERLPRLKKLSLSGCELQSLPARWFLPLVTELRLAQNHLTSLQPDGVILRSLHILDLSHNLLTTVTTLRRCRFLEQLNLRGNPLIEDGEANDKAAGVVMGGAKDSGVDAVPATTAATVPVCVQQRVARLFPAVKLLDGQPLMSAQEIRVAYKRGREAAAAAEKEAVAGDAEDVEGGELAEKHQPVKSSPARKVLRVDAAQIAAEAEEKDVVVEAPASVVRTTHAPIVRRERVLLRPDAMAAGGQAATSAAAQQAKAGKGKPGSGKKGASSAAAASAPVVYGQAAVAKLLEQSRKTSAW